jgi:cytosine/adenosine deaminase-related metal-dependent hydrolase
VHASADSAARDLGNGAIIPGLVNAHTHLELSDVAVPLRPSRPFTSWLKEVMSHRRQRVRSGPANRSTKQSLSDQTAIAPCIRQGMSESSKWGTTTIGDIAGPVPDSESGPNCENSLAPPPRSVAFLELLGLAVERVSEQLQRGREHLAGDSGDQRVIRGLSPHAPYSVHPDLFRGLVDLAVARRAPIAMHLAETREELQLLDDGTGPFVAFLEELGVWRPGAIPHGSRPLDYLRELARAETALAIHGNYLAPDEIDFLAAHSNISVVYCPRTHAYFGHAAHPWRRLLAQGVNVALGTDSRASNPDLSLWNELLFLRTLAPDFDLEGLLKLGTLNGAISLGLGHETGTVDVGKSADLAFVEFAEGDSAAPYDLLFRSENRVIGTMCRGQWIGPFV